LDSPTPLSKNIQLFLKHHCENLSRPSPTSASKLSIGRLLKNARKSTDRSNCELLREKEKREIMKKLDVDEVEVEEEPEKIRYNADHAILASFNEYMNEETSA
jgi:hypothetical protein